MAAWLALTASIFALVAAGFAIRAAQLAMVAAEKAAHPPLVFEPEIAARDMAAMQPRPKKWVKLA